jgi:hypothetical protein
MEQTDEKAVVHPAETPMGSGFETVDRAAASGAVGRGFKSLRARQFKDRRGASFSRHPVFVSDPPTALL